MLEEVLIRFPAVTVKPVETLLKHFALSLKVSIHFLKLYLKHKVKRIFSALGVFPLLMIEEKKIQCCKERIPVDLKPQNHHCEISRYKEEEAELITTLFC